MYENGPEIKIFLDLLGNFHTSQLRDAVHEFDEFDIFKILYLKTTFWQIGPKFKTLPDLLENVHSINLEGVECISNMDILRYFTKILNLYKLVLKLKSRWVYLKFCSRANI